MIGSYIYIGCFQPWEERNNLEKMNNGLDKEVGGREKDPGEIKGKKRIGRLRLWATLYTVYFVHEFVHPH